jgi:SAM-dependent methyltransferase
MHSNQSQMSKPAAPAPSKPPAVARPFSAQEILALHKVPLYGIDGFAMHAGIMEISGLALAVDGDLETVAFKGDPGIEFSVVKSIPNKGAGDFYWYWPGAETSAFQLRIDMAASRSTASYYKFDVAFAGFEDRPLERYRTTFVVPKYLDLLENFPSQDGHPRIQTVGTVNSVAVTGMTDAFRMCRLARLYGWDGSGDVLDWGIEFGRVARYVDYLSENATVWGVDIDPQAIGWTQEHLPHLKTSLGPLMPRTDYADDQFSFVYGLAVMTHLERSVQEAWLEEIRRILRPGGLAALTFAGDTAVAFASRWLDREFLETYLRTGFAPSLPNNDLVGVITTPEYYKNVHQSIRQAERICSRYFDVVGSHECMYGYQDLLILRKS